MTNKASELLEKALEELIFQNAALRWDEPKVIAEIRAYLAQPEVKQDDEPVATLDHNGNFKLLRMVGVTVGQPINLYALEEKNK